MTTQSYPQKQWVTSAVLLIRTSVEYATERCGFVVGRFDFEMNDYPELSTETVGNFGGFAY